MSAKVVTGSGFGGFFDVLLRMEYVRNTGIVTPLSPYEEVMACYDPFINAMLRFVPEDSVHLPFCLPLGFKILQTPGNTQQEGSFMLSSPVDLSLPRSDFYDAEYYASRLHSVASLVSILGTGSAPILPDHSRERFCRHTTFGGRGAFPIVSGFLESPPLGGSYPAVCGSVASSDIGRPTPFCWVIRRSDSFSQLEEFPYGTWILSRFITSLQKEEWSYGTGVQTHRATCHVFDVTNNADKLEFSITTNVTLQGPYYADPEVTYSWTYTFKADLAGLLASIRMEVQPSYPDYWWFPLDAGFVSINVHQVSNTMSYQHPVPTTSSLGFAVHPYAHLRVLPGLLPPLGTVDMPLRPGWWSARKFFRQAVDSSWKDIIPSSLFATVNAIGNIEHGTNTDVLQTLAKLPQYSSMMPKIAEAIDVLGDIVSKRVDLLTVKEILDLASATMLQGSFQWRPFLQLLTVELPKILASLAVLRSSAQPVVGRGVFKWDFPTGTFARSSSHLMTRSKIVLDVSARALASSLLGYDALGILPKVSNLWDLVPFSFVANWFTGIGASIKRAEYSAFLGTIPAYYVHSYAISSPFEDSELTKWNLVSNRNDPLSLRLYYRDVSLFVPLPRDSRFGFGIPTNLPPVGVVSALLYQLLF